MTIDKLAVNAIADAIIKAAKTVTEQNNKQYVNNQIRHVNGSTVGGYTIYDADGDAIAGVIAGMNKIGKLIIREAIIDIARIDDLRADFGSIVKLSSKYADIVEGSVGTLNADISKLTLVNTEDIKSKSISVEIFSADNVFIRDGVSEKHYMDDVSAAGGTIGALALGELYVNDTNGNLVRIYVENGQVKTESMDTTDSEVVIDGSKSDQHIVNGSITANDINGTNIFGSKGRFLDLISDTLQTTSLYSASAEIPFIDTTVLSHVVVGENEEESDTTNTIQLGETRIRMIVESGEDAGEVSLTKDTFKVEAKKIEMSTDTFDLAAGAAFGVHVKQIIEEELGYKMDIFATTEILSDKKSTSRLSVLLYRGKNNITDSIAADNFVWERTSDDAQADVIWNADSKHKWVKYIDVAADDVGYSSSFTCKYITEGEVLASAMINIVDMGDGRVLSMSLASNCPFTQIYDAETGTYAPNWVTNNLTITPIVIEDKNGISNSDTSLNVVYKRRINGATEEDLADGEVVSGNILTVSKNVLTAISSGIITYVAHASYSHEDGVTTRADALLSFSLLKSGVSGSVGESAVVLSLYAPNGTVFVNSDGTLPINAAAYDGTTEVSVEDATFVWKKFISGDWNVIAGQSGKSINVSGSDINGAGTYQCTMTYNSVDYVATISLIDKSDNFQAIIDSTGGNIFKNGTGQSKLTCRLFQGGNEIDENGTRYTYRWYLVDKDGNDIDWKIYDKNGADTGETVVHKSGKTINVTGNDVLVKTTFYCEVTDQTEQNVDERLKTVAQFTITDITDPIQSDVAPMNPEIGTLWIDTSTEPNTMKRWDGEKWVGVNEADLTNINNRVTTLESSIEAQNGVIALKASREDLEMLGDRVTASEVQIAELNVAYDGITMAVGRKSTAFRQSDAPEDAAPGDLWVKPVENEGRGGELAHTEETWQALDPIDVLPEFAYDDDGNLIYRFDDSVDEDHQYSIITEDNVMSETYGYLKMQSQDELAIKNDRLAYIPRWKKVVDEGYASLSIRADGIEASVKGLNGNYSALSLKVGGISTQVVSNTGAISIVDQKAEGIITRVTNAEGNIATVTTTANKINWIVASGTNKSDMTMTNEALIAIANNINLSANNTVRITSANQITVDARNNLDLSGNNSVRITSAGQISVAAIDALNLSSNNSIKMTASNVAIETVNKLVRVDSQGLHVGEINTSKEMLLDSEALSIIFNGVVYSKFASNYVQFGNYQLRQSADGGLVFKIKE